MSGFNERQAAFERFHKKTGLKPFSPDFLDALIATIRFSECLAERIYAWVKWRAWGNSSTYTVSDWDERIARPLDQTDCIVDLAWFNEGKSPEWVTGAPDHVRTGMREQVKNFRGNYSREFSTIEAQNRIALQGHKIYPIVSPGDSPPPKVVDSSNFRSDPKFLEYWKVADSNNFSAWEVARFKFLEFQKLMRQSEAVARIAYEEYRKQATPAPPIPIDIKTEVITAAAGAESAAADPTPTPPGEAEQLREALAPYGSADLDTARRIIARSRQRFPEATIQDILLMAEEKARSITASVKNPIAFLVEVIPNGFEGYTRSKERGRAVAVMESRAPAITCAKCQKPIEPGESVINGQCGDCFILSSA